MGNPGFLKFLALLPESETAVKVRCLLLRVQRHFGHALVPRSRATPCSSTNTFSLIGRASARASSQFMTRMGWIFFMRSVAREPIIRAPQWINQ